MSSYVQSNRRPPSRAPRGSIRPPSPVQLGQSVEPVKTARARRGPLVVGGIAIYCFAAYGTYLYMASSKGATATQDSGVPEDVSDRYNKTAKSFDSEVNLTEKLMGLSWLRRSLAKQVSGHVLETSVGTGRNSQYYDLKRCKSITFVDQSPDMIEIGKAKFRETHPKYKNCAFITQSAHDFIPSPSPAGFDTVVQTMGLCSTANPAGLLQNLGRLSNPTNGRILLLEHGRSHYAWLNRILDNNAAAHADKHGCWWNKDIQGIVDESGLEVVEIQRYHFGTTWWVELRPKVN